MEEKFTCVIPVRYKSTRFLGKPLMSIHGKEMLLWVYENAKAASHVSDVIVAAYDEEIEKFCKNQELSVVRIDESCKNGSEAVADVARKLDEEWVFEMQGDQPLVTPDIIDDFLERSSSLVQGSEAIQVVIPFAPATEDHTNSPDVLKVVKTESNRLVFQTRQPIRTGWRTLGLYLWKRESNIRFSELPVSDIERLEDSHPIRLYINDFYVQGLPIDTSDWVEVDREHQIAEVERIMKDRGIV